MNQNHNYIKELEQKVCELQSKLNAINELINPDWSKAPEWARYFAVDQNGIAFWFNNEPYPDSTTWRIDAHESQYAEAFRTRPDWKTTLVKRP